MDPRILKELRLARLKVKEGRIYYHYKNPKKYYHVDQLAIDEANHRILVVYTECNDTPRRITWVRSLDSWLEPVSPVTPRFTLYDDE